MRTNRRTEVFQLIIILCMFAASAVLWTRAPVRMPVHWNLAGEPDRYAGKVEGLLLMPFMALLSYGLLLLLPRIDPNRIAYDAFAHAYQVIRVALVAFFAALHAMLLLVAFGYPVNVSLVVPLGIGILFCLLGHFMGTFRPNWFVGVRTPWTLSSETSWNKTHRLAGWLFMVTGFAMFLLAVLHNAWTLAIVLGLVALMVIGLPVYSYFVWRDDPQRKTNPTMRT
ncbi:MAG: SdpI family protein [Pirellulales bacterium]|nr:SdpI family protein [Pirellulales bacterium]